MSQIRLTMRGKREGDCEQAADGSLIEDDGLDTLASNIIFTDARASADDDVPDDDRRGYWADAYEDDPTQSTGSKLWLLERSALTSEALKTAESIARDRLELLVAEGIATRVVTSCVRVSDETALLSAYFYKPGSNSPHTLTWELHFALQ